MGRRALAAVRRSAIVAGASIAWLTAVLALSGLREASAIAGPSVDRSGAPLETAVDAPERRERRAETSDSPPPTSHEPVATTSAPEHTPAPRVTAPPARTRAAVASKARQSARAEPSRTENGVDCSVPYDLDAKGNRHYKVECL